MTSTAINSLIASSAVLATLSRQFHNPWIHYLLKPLTMVLIILMAVSAPASTYKTYILAGLLASLAGDIFLMLPSDRFIPGLASFLVAHLCYIAAFFTSTPGAPTSLLAAIPLLGGLGMLTMLWQHLGALKYPVIAYTTAIVVMVIESTTFFDATPGPAGSYALAGTLLFMASDSILAIDRFRFHGTLKPAQFLILSTYFAAQWFLAKSLAP